MVASTTNGPAPHQVSKIAPYRWHVISNVSAGLGWSWIQVSSTEDRFTKNGLTINASWTSGELREASGDDGFAIRYRDQAKLQKLCRALGADIRDDQLFKALPADNIARLPDIDDLRQQAMTGLQTFAAASEPPKDAFEFLSGEPPGLEDETGGLLEAVSSMADSDAPWNISPGEDYTRRQIAEFHGGDHRYRGIVPLDADIVIYSDHKNAGDSGYYYDGWSAERSAFYYTGEGSKGDQVFKGGNSAIRDHKNQSRALRLFVAVGNESGSTTRVHRYVGRFETDTDAPHLKKQAPGLDGLPRELIVFHLRPVGEVITHVGQLSAIKGVATSSMVSAVHVEAVPESVITAERAEFERATSGMVVQKEALLSARFREFLVQSHGREVKRYKITTPRGLLFTDIADITSSVLYEAKGTAERMAVRLALGQVLDYGRYVDGASLAILLPEAPDADLVELLESHGVGCVVEAQPGTFVDMTTLRRCPQQL